MKLKFNKSKNKWNYYYDSSSESSINVDNWLIKYDHLFKSNENILEVGCGFAFNSLYLLSKNHNVLLSDFSQTALKYLKRKNNNINIIKIDLRKKIKLTINSFDSIIADLCIHYFNFKTTKRIINDFRLLLKQNGKLFCRVNSIYDKNHGVGQGIEIEKNFYYQNGLYKKFFEENELKSLFSNWNIMHIINCDIKRYKKTKNIFEIVCTKHEL